MEDDGRAAGAGWSLFRMWRENEEALLEEIPVEEEDR